MPKNLLQTNLGFNLNLTPLLKNSIKLLSMPYTELLSEINQALEKNIVLTENNSYEDDNFISNRSGIDENYQFQVESKDSFFSNLESQLLNSTLSHQDCNIAKIIFENLTEEGFLEVNIDAIGRAFKRQHPHDEINTNQCESVRQYIQVNFEPLGIASFNTQDFLLFQINQLHDIKDKSLISELLLGKLDINKINSKQRDYLLSIIKTLAKTPVDSINVNDQNQYIQTDVTIENNMNEWQVKLRSLPAITLNKEYLSLRSRIKDKSLFNEHLIAARGLIGFIEYRNQLLQTITGTLVEKQRQALQKGLRYLKPLSQKQLAQELNIGESSLSRLLKGKYADTPIGVIQIKDLFSSSVNHHSSTSVKQMVNDIINKENKALSDQKITNLLIQKGIHISRRTVTKYRKALKIPCARDRGIMR